MKAKRKTIKHPHDNIASITHVPYKEGKNKFEIYIRKKYSPTGKPQRLYKATQNIAKDYVNELTDELGEYGASSLKQINPDQRADAARALKILSATGFKELYPAILYLKDLKEKEDAKSDVTIAQIVREKIEDIEKKNEILKKGQKVRGGSRKTLIEYNHYGKWLCEDWENLRVVDFDEEKHFLPIYNERRCQTNFLKCSKVFFNYCIKKHKGKIIKINPITEEKIKLGEHEVKVFKPDQWKRLIHTAVATEGQEYTKNNAYEFTAMVVLGLWCGLRPEAEMRQVEFPKDRLKWEDVDLEEKEVWVYSTKTLKYRHVKIPDCAIPILRNVRQKKGFIVKDLNYAKRFRDFTARAGVSSKQGIWHNDIMRHTYATYYHAKFNDEKELIKQIGHVDDRELKFYRKFGKEYRSQAEEFWNFTPPISQCTGSGNPDLKIA